MNIETSIRTDLWAEISVSYEACDYRNAIINAMHFLTNMLREKADSELDGYKLAADALGGSNPKLKINRFQTQSEKDEQEGFAQIVMGLYKGIRNPRSHETITDTVTNADVIISFINYIVTLIDKSNPTFTLDGFLSRIFDPDFVINTRYVSALVSEIPKKKLGEVLIEIYRRRESENLEKMKLLVTEIITLMPEADVNDYIKVVSDELQKVSNNGIIISSLNMVPPNLWERIKKAPKIRIENKLINSISRGEVYLTNPNELRGKEGALGTWASIGFIKYFDLKVEIANVLITKLNDSDYEDNLYVFNYFLNDLPNVFFNKSSMVLSANAVSRLIKRGEKTICNKIYTFLKDRTDQWREVFLQVLSDLTDQDEPSFYLSDGTPFLGKERNIKFEEVEGDEIPF